MATWREDVQQALTNLGGVAPLRDIYTEVKRIRSNQLPPNWESAIRATIEDNSSDSKRYKNTHDVFFSAHGVGNGIWGVRSAIHKTPKAEDISEQIAPKVKVDTYRILRDTELARTIKALYGNKCQICGTAIQLANGETYSEAHHVKPLGSPHNGPDIAENILILCPNHHVMCDYGAIEISFQKLHIHEKHIIGQQFITYHNSSIKK